MKNFEQLRISVYDDSYLDFTAGSDCHFKTHKILLNYSEVLAIATKLADVRYGKKVKRGGALVYVKGRNTPYLTNDTESVNQIYAKINRNPFGCYSGLRQVGSSNLYAKEYIVIDENTILLTDINVRLKISHEAYRKLKWVAKVKNGKILKSCFFETKNHLRKKYQKL